MGGVGQFQLAKLMQCVWAIRLTPPPLIPHVAVDRLAQKKKNKKQSGGRMHKRQRSAYWVWKDTQIQRERRWMSVVLWKSGWGWQNRLSLFLSFYLSPLHLSFSLCRLCFSSFDKSVFPEMFGHRFPPSCLVFRCPDFLCQLPAGVQSHISA